MKIEITKERVLEAASKCETAKQTLKTLFPEVFIEEEIFWEMGITWPKNLYFTNNKGDTFFIGDRITMKNSCHKFGDGVRDHTIRAFYINNSTQLISELNGTKYKKVFALFEGYSSERALSLDDMILIKRCK